MSNEKLFIDFRENSNDDRLEIPENLNNDEKELGFLVMEALALLLSHNQKNASSSLI